MCMQCKYVIVPFTSNFDRLKKHTVLISSLWGSGLDDVLRCLSTLFFLPPCASLSVPSHISNVAVLLLCITLKVSVTCFWLMP